MARNFNGSSDFISTGEVGPLFGPPITIAAWVLPGGSTAVQDIADFGVNANTQEYRLQYNNQNFVADDRDVGGDGVATGSFGTVTPSAWNHAAAVFLGNVTNGIIVYANGRNKVTANGHNSVARRGTSIGCLNLPSVANFNFYTGAVGEVTIWAAQLSDAEIALLATGVTADTVRPQSIISYFDLRDRGGFAINRSMWGNNGVLTGTTYLPDTSPVVRRQYLVPRLATPVPTGPTLTLMAQILLSLVLLVALWPSLI